MERVPSLEEFELNIATVVHQTRMARVIKVLEVKQVNEKKPDLFGYYTLRYPAKNKTSLVPFAISVNGWMGGSECPIVELRAIVKLGSAIERRRGKEGVQVIDISLPPSFGFTGIRYGFSEVKRLFPHFK